MRKLLMAAALACGLALSACGGVTDDVISTPKPLAGTSVDNRGIALAFEVANQVRIGVGTLRAAGHSCCTPGTPEALKNADRLDAVAKYLEAASAAQRLGDTGLASLNLTRANALLGLLRGVVSRSTSSGNP